MSDLESNTIHTGDVREVLPDLPANSVHMCMTSPPYWNLRDYGHEDQLGLEPESETYVQRIAEICDEIHRVLRDDGSFWLNLGDTYDNKDLQQIPARVAIELQSRGWILRNRVTWAKPNPMPQSVKDRLNDTTEAIFHFVKQGDYRYDLDAIREPHAESSKERIKHGLHQNHPEESAVGVAKTETNEMGERFCNPAGKNPGDVFEVTTKPFPDAHFAVYPPELCEKPLKATCPPKVCAACGTPYERQRETEDRPDRRDREKPRRQYDGNPEGHNNRTSWVGMPKDVVDEWWEQACDCDTDATEKGIALDPFAGAGTTLLKAKELGRRFVGIELNPEYADMARARVGLAPNDLSNVRENDAQVGLESFGVCDDT